MGTLKSSLFAYLLLYCSRKFLPVAISKMFFDRCEIDICDPLNRIKDRWVQLCESICMYMYMYSLSS